MQEEFCPPAPTVSATEGTAAGAGGDPGRGPPLEQLQGEQQQYLPLLPYVSVGAAGWGEEGAAEQYRGSKWTAHCGLVLNVADAASAAAAAAAAAGEPEPLLPPLPPSAAVHLFRNYSVQLGGLEGVMKGLRRTDWDAYGFRQEASSVAADASGAISLRLSSAQPKTGACSQDGCLASMLGAAHSCAAPAICMLLQAWALALEPPPEDWVRWLQGRKLQLWCCTCTRLPAWRRRR